MKNNKMIKIEPGFWFGLRSNGWSLNELVTLMDCLAIEAARGKLEADPKEIAIKHGLPFDEFMEAWEQVHTLFERTATGHWVAKKGNINIAKKPGVKKTMDEIIDKLIDELKIPGAYKPLIKEWRKYKSEKGQAYKPSGMKAFIKKLHKLSKGNPKKAEEIIEQSMSNNWAGIFPMKETWRQQASPPPKRFDDPMPIELMKKFDELFGADE